MTGSTCIPLLLDTVRYVYDRLSLWQACLRTSVLCSINHFISNQYCLILIYTELNATVVSSLSMPESVSIFKNTRDKNEGFLYDHVYIRMFSNSSNKNCLSICSKLTFFGFEIFPKFYFGSEKLKDRSHHILDNTVCRSVPR